MAVVSTCAVPIKGTHMRIVALDVCGVPVTGSSGLVVVHDSFIQVAQEFQYEEGEEFFDRTADGVACVNQKDDPTLKRINLTTQLCAINVSGASYVISARELVTGSPTTGTGFAVAEGEPTNRYSMEVWQRVAGSGACDASGNQRYIYHAWPNVGATMIGNYTVENAKSMLEYTSETRGASEAWLDLVGSAWLPSGETVLTDEHWLFNVTTVAPPEAACDPTELAA